MSTTFTVGPLGLTNPPDRPWIYAPGQTHELVTLVNTGANVAYLDDQKLPSASSGIPLSAGSTLPWDKDLPLFVTSPLGTTIVVSPNGSTPFDAGAVASQLITQGLAGDIATAIYLQGNKAADVVNTVFTTTLESIPAGTRVSHNIDFGESGSYSLSLNVVASTASAADLSSITLELKWYLDPGYSILTDLKSYTTYSQNGALFFGTSTYELSGAVKGRYLTVTYGSSGSPAGPYNMLANGRIDGHTTPKPEKVNLQNLAPSLVSTTYWFYNHDMYSIRGTVPALGVVLFYLPTRKAPAKLSFMINTASVNNGVTCQVNDMAGNQIPAFLAHPATAPIRSVLSTDFHCPASEALIMRFANLNTATAISVFACLTFGEY